MSSSGLFGLPIGTGINGVGQFFLMVCYGYILFKAAVLIGDGSEKLLLLYGPGVVGGLIIPVLGAVPDAAIVLVSGLGTNVQCKVDVGIGCLAGSTIMLLTIPFAFSLFVGCRDANEAGDAASLPNGKPKYVNGFQIKSSCITTFKNTTYAARIMMATTLLYLIILIPALVLKNEPLAVQAADEQIPALVCMVVCALAFIAYGAFQIVDSNMHTQQQMKQQKLKFMQWKKVVGSRVASTQAAIKTAFEKFDKDGNGTIDTHELQEGFACLGLELDRSQVTQLMTEMDEDGDKSTLNYDEFQHAVQDWSQQLIQQQSINYSRVLSTSRMNSSFDRDLHGGGSEVNLVQDLEFIQENEELKHADEDQDQDQDTANTNTDNNNNNNISTDGNNITVDVNTNTNNDSNGNEITQKSGLLKNKEKSPRYLAVDDNEIGALDEDYSIDTDRTDADYILSTVWKELQQEEAEEEEMFLELSDRQLVMRAGLQLFIGTVLVVLFSDPMVGVINNFAVTITVPAFFVSFIITPVASNAAEIYAAILFASKKSTEGISMGLSALYGAACMNSTLVLAIFAALVYFRRLEWTFITETLVILMTMLVVGGIGLRKTIVVWQGFIILALFPLSLVFVALLDPVLDDSTGCGTGGAAVPAG